MLPHCLGIIGLDCHKLMKFHNNSNSLDINTKKYHVFAPMGRFQLESIYLYFPPSSQLVENKGKLIHLILFNLNKNKFLHYIQYTENCFLAIISIKLVFIQFLMHKHQIV